MRVYKMAKSEYQLLYICLSIHPSVRIGQLSSQWTDFHKILYLSIFRKSVKII